MPTDALDDSQLRRLIAVGRSLVEKLDTEALLSEILAASHELTGARYAAIGIIGGDDEPRARWLTRGIDEQDIRAIGELPRGRGILRTLTERQAPLRVDDLQDPPRAGGLPVGRPPMRSFLGVPITVRGTAWGTLCLTEKRARAFDVADEQALMVLADWAAIALDHAEVYAQLHARNASLSRLNRMLSTTTAIVRAVGTETSLKAILDQIVTRARSLVDARTMCIFLPHGDQLEIAAAAGARGRALPGTRVPIAASSAGAVLRDGRPRRLPADRLGIPPERFGIDEVTNCLLVPLIFRGRALGVLLALDHADAPATFSRDDEELLLAFAANAATAVATGQNAIESRLRNALDGAERERHRWARELHDETLQGLAGLQLRLSVAARQSRDPETTAAIGAAHKALNEEIQRLRTLITELRPAALDEVGLAPALESLVSGVEATTGLSIDLHVAIGDERPGAELETTLYRVVQEALTNVVKHASATNCLIEVVRRDDGFEVLVRDDGRGLEPDALERRHGFGITGMRERAHLSGGTLTLGPGSTGGTELRVRLPVSAQRAVP